MKDQTKTSSDHKRILIIGNSGSGKTWLARKLGEALRLPIIHLDNLRWEPGHRGIARDKQVVVDEVMRAGEAEAWLMEGVYGWLASAVFQRVETLIWLDLPEEECLANARERGVQAAGGDGAFRALEKWISEYRTRATSSGFMGHSQLFEAFPGSKTRLRSRAGIVDYLKDGPLKPAIPYPP